MSPWTITTQTTPKFEPGNSRYWIVTLNNMYPFLMAVRSKRTWVSPGGKSSPPLLDPSDTRSSVGALLAVRTNAKEEDNRKGRD